MQKRAGKKRKQNSRIWLLCLTAVILVSGAGSFARAALENEKSSAVRAVHVKDNDIEVSTIVIGSHLIHINALTTELYNTALESANEFNQNQIYYKSELANGGWFEISDATSIADITTAGTPVSKSVIENLDLTHHTKSDGITIDLRSGQAVSVCDITNPYDLNSMEELEPIRLQYQILQEKENKTDSDDAYLKMIGEFFGESIQNETTDECDEALTALGNYKNGLPGREKPSRWVEKTEEIMVSVDAKRRVVSLSILADNLDALESLACGFPKPPEEKEETEEESEEEEEEEEPLDLIVNSDIVAAIGDSIKNVQQSIASYEAKMLTDSGETASAKAEYRYQQELITRAKNKDTPGCDEMMEMLCNLENILDDVIADQKSELNTLTSDLVNAAYTKYMGDLKAGVSQDYQTARAEGAAASVLSNHLSAQKAAANADRLEYQTLLEAQFKRMENKAAQEYNLKLIDGVPGMEATILQDPARSYLKETVQEHLIWLRKTYSELVQNDLDATDMSKLEKEKDDLAKKRQDALDNNDLAGANKLEAEMEAKQKDIDALASSLNNILNSPNSSESDKARAAAGLGGNNTSSLLGTMADTLASAIRSSDSDGSDLANQLAALSAAAQLDPEAGEAALGQVQNALSDSTELDKDAMNSLSDALDDALEDTRNAQGTGDLSGLSADELANVLDDILASLLGTSFAEASSSQQAAAMIAMDWFGERKNSAGALELAATLAKQTAQSNNPYLYEKYQGKKATYLSLQAYGKVMAYRYIFDDKHNTVTLQKSKDYFVFTLAKKEYEMTGKTKKNLVAAPELQNTLYIKVDDSTRIFETKAEYIEKANYGVVVTAPVETLAKEIYDKLVEGGV